MTEKTVNLVKDKVKNLATDAMKQMKRSGKIIPKANPDEPSLFPGALGKYIKSKNIPTIIQQAISGKISDEDVNLYNSVYIDYMRSKRKLQTIDEKVDALTS